MADILGVTSENYLTQARLPWRTPTLVEPTFEHSTSHLTTSTNPDHPLAHPNPIPVHETSHLETPGPGSTPASGASTPSSAGFVSLDSLKMVNGLLRRSRKRSSTPTPGISGIQSRDDAADGQESYGKWNPGSEVLGEVDGEDPVYLKWEEGRGLDAEKIAVLPNDWPYNVPHGVRHYCVWSRVSHSRYLSSRRLSESDSMRPYGS